jgi:hypothetical protein
MAEEKLKYEIISRRVIVDYPSLTEEVRIVHTVFRYKDLPPMSIDIPEKEYSEELEDKRIQEEIKKELERLGRKE